MVSRTSTRLASDSALTLGLGPFDLKKVQTHFLSFDLIPISYSYKSQKKSIKKCNYVHNYRDSSSFLLVKLETTTQKDTKMNIRIQRRT